MAQVSPVTARRWQAGKLRQSRAPKGSAVFKTVLLATATTLALGAAVPPASAQNARPADPCQQACDAAAWQQLAHYYAAHIREAAAQQAAARERAAAEASQAGKHSPAK